MLEMIDELQSRGRGWGCVPCVDDTPFRRSEGDVGSDGKTAALHGQLWRCPRSPREGDRLVLQPRSRDKELVDTIRRDEALEALQFGEVSTEPLKKWGHWAVHEQERARANR